MSYQTLNNMYSFWLSNDKVCDIIFVCNQKDYTFWVNFLEVYKVSSVVVLNASWEPLSRTRLSRAVAMIKAGIAVIHEAVDGEFLHSASGEVIPKPKVLRLVRYVAVKTLQSPAKWSKRGVLIRDNRKCGYCNSRATTVDHIIPKSRGGKSTDWFNTVACCLKCNNRKGSRTNVEAGMSLLWKPRHPRKIELSFGWTSPQKSYA